MDKQSKARERRKQARLERLKTERPVCIACGNHDWRCFEDHHIAGCKYCALTAVHCKNCHAIASDKQYDHPTILFTTPSKEDAIGRLLLGLADFFEQLIETLREFGKHLIDIARTPGDGAAPPGGDA